MGENTSLSRAEIEIRCVLFAIGEGARSHGEIAERLGLSSQLAPAIAHAMAPMVDAGLVREEAGVVRLTESGRQRLASR